MEEEEALTKAEYLALRIEDREWLHSRLGEFETTFRGCIAELQVADARLPCKAHDVAIGEVERRVDALEKRDVILKAAASIGAGLGTFGAILAGYLGLSAGKPPQYPLPG